MIINKNKFFLFFILLTIHVLFSQNKFDDFQFRIVKEGISQKAIYSIAQDAFGFIWVGTNGAGLFRYDGVNYLPFEANSKKKNAINSNKIYVCYVDKKNQLWVGTDEGLCLYNRALNNFENIILTQNKLQKNISVKCIVEDNGGNLLLGTTSNCFLKVNTTTKKSQKIITGKIPTTFATYCIVKDNKNRVFLGTSSGVMVYNLQTKSFVNYGNNPILANSAVESLLIDANNNLWVGTGNKGLFKFSLNDTSQTPKSYLITSKRIFSIAARDAQNIFCGTENDGLFLVDENGKVKKKYVNDFYNNKSLQSNSVWSLFLDKENRLWLGYYNKGVGVFDKYNSKIKILQNTISDNNTLRVNSVTSIVADKKGLLWIAMEGGGVDVFDAQNNKMNHINKDNFSYFSGLLNDNITCIHIDKNENIWLGSWDFGVYFLKKGSKNFINYNAKNSPGLLSDRVMSITEDKKGVIWIGTFHKGVHYFDPQKKQFFNCNSRVFFKDDFYKLDVSKIITDANNAIWVGTGRGLFKIKTTDYTNFTLTSYREQMAQQAGDYNRTHTIISIFEAKNKTIWVGCEGAGLFSYSPTTNKINWRKDFKGFEDKSVSAITEYSDDNLWVSGNLGISKLNLKSKIAENFSAKDGIVSTDFNKNAVYKDGKGILYFGSLEGLNYFDPKKIATTNKQIPLYFSDLKIFNSSVQPNENDSPLENAINETKKISLKHKQSVFTIEYVGLNYSFPSNNSYAYILEGFENKWNYVGSNRSATYTNLPAGNYTFKVKVAEKNGSWETKPIVLSIEILPPWYKSTWSYLLYLFLLSYGGYVLVKFYQNKFKQNQMRQLEREKGIELEKLNTNKLQFFTNISHEFRTPLTLIASPLNDILNSKTEDLSPQMITKLKVVNKSANRLTRLVNELMDFEKLQYEKAAILVQKTELVFFTEDVVSYFSEEAISRGIVLRFFSDKEKLNDWVDPSMFEKILFNVLSNAFKVTPDNGKIEIALHADIEATFPLIDTNAQLLPAFEIVIKDTGAGLDKKDVDKIFDRFYQVDTLNKTYYGSTGIGLEVVRSFVALHKGKITVESTLGVGTTFRLIFPLGKQFFAANEIATKKYVKPKKLDNFINKEQLKEEVAITKTDVKPQQTLLIVEDNPELRNYLKSELKYHYKIIAAENGQVGYDVAVDKIPDIIVTDVIMPIMSGIDFCKAIKGNSRTSHIPVLMLSAKSMVQDKLDGIDSGADMYLSKPFEMDILKASLAQLINSRQLLFEKFYTGTDAKAKQKTTVLDNEFVKKVSVFIHKNISETDLNVELLASNVGLGRSQLYRKVKSLTGVSVNEFIRNVRLDKAKELILEGNSNINEISYQVGFSYPSYFTKCYKDRFGHLPTQETSAEGET